MQVRKVDIHLKYRKLKCGRGEFRVSYKIYVSSLFYKELPIKVTSHCYMYKDSEGAIVHFMILFNFESRSLQIMYCVLFKT